MFGGDGEDRRPVSSYTYRDVGTNIDCGATFDEAVPGIFQLAVTVSDSSLGLDAAKSDGAVAPDVPSFRNFNSVVHRAAARRPDDAVHVGDRSGDGRGDED